MSTFLHPEGAPPAGRRRFAPGTVTGSNAATADIVTGSSLVAALGVVVIAMDLELASGMTAGTLLTLSLVPVWLPTAVRSRAFRWIAVLAVAAAAAGVLLTGLSAGSHHTSTGNLVRHVLLILGLVTATGWYLWSCRFLQPWLIGALFGFGLLLAIRPGTGMFADNPWRFGFSVPLTVLGLALAWRARSRWLGAGLAVALGAVSALNGGRSTFAMLLLTAVLVAWQGRATSVSRPRSVVRIALLVGSLAYVAYSVGQGLILEGYFGAETQLRTQAQIESSGSLILGGRPEAAASLALIRENPAGYGAGTVPAVHDIVVAKSAMAAINYDPNNGYVENFMFGGHFELHSVIGDLWVWCGFAGALLAMAVLAVVAHQLAARVAVRGASALLIFLVVKTVWNLAFSPLASAAPLMALTLGLLLATGPGRETHRASDRAAASTGAASGSAVASVR